MFKNWYTRLARIASGSFGSAKEDGFSLETSLTKFERFVHFWVLVCRSFVRNRCPVRASSLSYTTLVAMIPMLAVAISITNAILESKGEAHIRKFIEEFVEKMVPTPGVDYPNASLVVETGPIVTNRLDAIQFGIEELRTRRTAMDASGTNDPALLYPADSASLSNILGTLLAADSPSPTNQVDSATVAGATQVKQSVSKEAANFIYDFAKKSSSTALAGTGMIFLVLTAILMLTRVEETFNDIWGVTRGRDWWSRITNYFFTIALGPVLIIGALGLANTPNFQKTRDLINIVPFIEPLLSTYLPLFIICLAFALIYKVVPNTKVDFGAALVGGTLAGLAWHGYNQLGFLLTSQAVSASAVYGRLFVIPLLMGGLYVVWLTVLFGAQVAYAFQNRASYLQDRLVENVNQRGREFVALRLMTCIGQRFNQGQPPATIREISTDLGIPSKLVQQIMRTLLAAGLVVEVAGPESGYSPARPLETINCHHILLAMRATHGQEPATRDEPVRVEVLGEFARIQAAEKEAASSVTMLALVNRAQTRLALAAPIVVSNDLVLPAAVATMVAAKAADPIEPVSESPQVEFVEAASESTSAGAASLDELAHRAEVQIGAIKSISSPTPAVATNENESFPL